MAMMTGEVVWGAPRDRDRLGDFFFLGVAVIAVVVARAICDNGVP